MRLVEPSKVVAFHVGNEEYAIPIHHVVSIEKMEGITPIPHLPMYVRGITKARGELIPVIDLEQILRSRFIQNNETARTIVLRTDEMSIGILVNEVREIIDIPQEDIKQVGLVAYDRTSYFSGVGNLDSRLITFIDPRSLIQSLEGIREIQEFMKSQAVQ